MMRNTRNKLAGVFRLVFIALAMTAAGWKVAERVALLRVEQNLAADAERIAAAVCNSEDRELTIRAARLRGGARIAWIKVAEASAPTFRVVQTDRGRVAVAARAIGGQQFVEVAVYLDRPVARSRKVVLI